MEVKKEQMDAAVRLMFRDYDLLTDWDTGSILKSDGSWICNGIKSFPRFLIDTRIIVSEYGQVNRIKADEWLKVEVEEPTPEPTPAPVVETAKTHGPTGVEFKDILVRGGRTGRKVHRASSGGSGSDCGHWFKAHTSHFKISDDTLANRAKYHRTLCTKCFGEGAIARAKAFSNK